MYLDGELIQNFGDKFIGGMKWKKDNNWLNLHFAIGVFPERLQSTAWKNEMSLN